MKKDNPEPSKNPGHSPAPETPVSGRKEKKKEKKPTRSNDVQLPVLVELTYSVSVSLLIVVGLAVMLVSFLTGASLLDLVLRTSAAMLAMGSLVVVIFHLVSSGVLQASLVEQEEAQKAQTQELEIPESPANPETSAMEEAS